MIQKINLLDEDLGSFNDALATAFSRDQFNELLSTRCGAERRLDRITSNKSLDLQIVEVVAKARSEDWLVKLVYGAAELRPGNKELVRLVQVVRYQMEAINQAAKANPFDVVWLPRSRPMINRRGLRTKSRDMFVNDYARVMIIRGESRTGRSHSMMYFQHLAKTHKYNVVDLNLVNMAKENTRLNAYQLARVLTAGFGSGFIFAPNEDEKQDAFKVEPFAQDLTRVLKNQREQKWILIVDGFDKVEPEDSGLSLVHRLATAAEQSLENLRVVLLGHNRDLLLELNHALIDHTAEFTDEDVCSYFECFYRDVLGIPAIPNEIIVTHVVEAMQAAPVGQPNVSAVSAKITEICRRLIAK